MYAQNDIVVFKIAYWSSRFHQHYRNMPLHIVHVLVQNTNSIHYFPTFYI
jgi:hypothetical protein